MEIGIKDLKSSLSGISDKVRQYPSNYHHLILFRSYSCVFALLYGYFINNYLNFVLSMYIPMTVSPQLWLVLPLFQLLLFNFLCYCPLYFHMQASVQHYMSVTIKSLAATFLLPIDQFGSSQFTTNIKYFATNDGHFLKALPTLLMSSPFLTKAKKS